MKHKNTALAAAFLLISALSAAAFGKSETAKAADGDLIYLNLIWHQHQPLYSKDADGVYTRPWVRVHATKDYWDMAETLSRYPKIKASINLTPVLMRQLVDLSGGAKDIYRVLAEKPAEALSVEEKRYLLERFFDANWQNIIKRHPRYAELLALRGESAGKDDIDRALTIFMDNDYRDLQLWFNLAWFDPDFLAKAPLKALVDKGRSFTEADKAILFAETDRIVKDVLPLHKRLKASGRIDVITTPYAHPILPLIYNSDLAKKADPSAKTPTRFSWPNDAIAHLEKAVKLYSDLIGGSPVGLWPGEGAVAQDVVRIIGQAGFQWMATGEPVLAVSLGIGSFDRDGNDMVIAADDLYRPYWTESQGQRVAVVFRDLRLSDLIGFEYSGKTAEAAVKDFMDRVERIRAALKTEGKKGPHLVSVILDGENAWENYPNDGKDFLDALYTALSASESVKTITPTEYIKKYPDQRVLPNLAEAAWFSADYATWIGEEEENVAWEYLGKVRATLAKYDVEKRRVTTEEKLAAALDAMYIAEGSDWFWWFGDDQDSGVDAYFDQAFRDALKNVYLALEEEIPAFLSEPIVGSIPPAGELGLDLGPLTPILSVDDPEGDDTGPGAYSYPTDAVFKPGVFDVSSLSISKTENDLVFVVSFRGPLENPWNSPIGLSLQTIDIYIDEDPGADSGARLLLEGRNAAAPKAYGWEKAVWIEGWNRKLFRVDENGKAREAPGEPRVAVDAERKTLTIAVPLAALGKGDPATWAYALAVLSQDGYPAPGVRRVRDIQLEAAQWRGGGAPEGLNHTRIYDFIWPEDADPSQAESLTPASIRRDGPLTFVPEELGVIRFVEASP